MQPAALSPGVKSFPRTLPFHRRRPRNIHGQERTQGNVSSQSKDCKQQAAQILGHGHGKIFQQTTQKRKPNISTSPSPSGHNSPVQPKNGQRIYLISSDW